MKFRYLLFDLDGTLTDPFEGITRSVQYALSACGIEEPDLKKLTPFIGPPLIDAFMGFYGMTENEANFAIEKYRERFSEKGWLENKIFDGIEELLHDLHNAGYILSLSTSKPEVFAYKIIDRFNIKKYFHTAVGATLDKTRNNKSAVIKETLKQLNVSPRELDSVIMIGDRMHDIEGAKANGIKSLGVEFGYAAPNELQKAGADFIVNTIEELRRFFL